MVAEEEERRILHVPYDGPLVTRAEARAASLQRYFTGRLCPQGHLSERYTSTGNCWECLAATGRAKALTRVRKKVGGARADASAVGDSFYWTGNPCRSGHITLRYTTNGTCVACSSEATKRDWLTSSDRIKKRKREYRKANPAVAGKQRQRARNWYYRNLKQAAVLRARRRARLLAATGSHNAADIAYIIRLQKGRCAYCRRLTGRKYHVDHIQAIARGGTNDRRNLQICCDKCNQAKNAIDPIIFAQRVGLLI